MTVLDPRSAAKLFTIAAPTLNGISLGDATEFDVNVPWPALVPPPAAPPSAKLRLRADPRSVPRGVALPLVVTVHDHRTRTAQRFTMDEAKLAWVKPTDDGAVVAFALKEPPVVSAAEYEPPPRR